MPKKMHVMEPAVIFHDLFRSTLEADREFIIHTDDSVYKPFAASVINEHYPSQTQLPID